MDEQPASISIHFASLEDPRTAHLVDQKLNDIIRMAICAVISGAETGTDIALFGQEGESWLRQFLELPHGTPSHDTFGRVFSLLDPEQFEVCFRRWVTSVFAATEGEVIAIDAMGTRTEIAACIIEQKADYVPPLNENQPHLLEDMELFFRLAQQNDFSLKVLQVSEYAIALASLCLDEND